MFRCLINIRNKRIIFFSILILSVLSIVACKKNENKSDEKKTLLVSSAISLKYPLEKISALYKNKKDDVDIIFNFASSGELENQIVQGADVDIFVSAGIRQIERLKEKNKLINETITTIAGGELVVVTSKKFLNKTNEVLNNKILQTNLDFLLEDNYKYIAIGETNTVPAGEYAAETLINSKIMKSVVNKLVYGRSVSEVLTWAETGNAEYGFVYKSDAINSDKVVIVYNVEGSMHKTIIYQAAVVLGSKSEENIYEAKSFISFLLSDEVKNIFAEYGFK